MAKFKHMAPKSTSLKELSQATHYSLKLLNNKKSRITLIDAQKFYVSEERRGLFLGGFEGLDTPYMQDFCHFLFFHILKGCKYRHRHSSHDVAGLK